VYLKPPRCFQDVFGTIDVKRQVVKGIIRNRYVYRLSSRQRSTVAELTLARFNARHFNCDHKPLATMFSFSLSLSFSSHFERHSSCIDGKQPARSRKSSQNSSHVRDANWNKKGETSPVKNLSHWASALCRALSHFTWHDKDFVWPTRARLRNFPFGYMADFLTSAFPSAFDCKCHVNLPQS